jgi:N-acetyl-gamma-glutamyl-phosphate reductase
VANDAPVGVTFVPHLTPMIRGIHATLYARLTNTQESLETIQAWFESRYIDHPFVDVMPLGSHPETRSVRGSNICRIALHQPQGDDTLVILSAIDNLVKGAAGQAIHNMNLMLGLEETAGLSIVPLAP